MAKIALFLLFALVAVQLSNAARIAREEPKTPEAPKSLDDLLNQVNDFIKTNINQEQLDKLKKLGEELGAKGKELLEQTGKSLQQLGEKKE